jgi:cytochrome d ubiquinol oxidase subunit II
VAHDPVDGALTMDLAALVLLLMGVALTVYVLLGGADFGGGTWDLLARGPRKQAQRALIEQAIGPVWEANHVWLILVVVVLFSAFPGAFADYMITLHIPITAALIGIVLRGSSFAFRSYGAPEASAEEHRWGRVFAVASTVTPFMLGTCVGALAAGRVHLVDGRPALGYLGSWLAPFPLTVGLFTVALFSFLAAVYLTLESADPALQDDFRRRALGASVVAGLLAALAGILAREGAPRVWHVLVTVSGALPFQLATAATALSAIWALLVRRYRVARACAALQVTFVLWGWFASQYPYFIAPDLTFHDAAAPDVTLRIVLLTVTAGGAAIVPSFYLLFRTFKGTRSQRTGAEQGR